MPDPVRVLALHAHPDDIEFQCAGTLILLREAGCSVTMATMTPGDCGSAEHDAASLPDGRVGLQRTLGIRVLNGVPQNFPSARRYDFCSLLYSTVSEKNVFDKWSPLGRAPHLRHVEIQEIGFFQEQIPATEQLIFI